MRSTFGMPSLLCFSVALAVSYSTSVYGQTMPSESYIGMAEASAAVMLDDRHFVVAEDECNVLLTYLRGNSKPVGAPTALAAFLKTEGKVSDIEAGARIGDTVY